MARYDVGDRIRVDADFGGDDPENLTFELAPPTGDARQWTFGEDDELVKDAPGRFHIFVVPDETGRWSYQWIATGDVQAAEPGSFHVREPAPVWAPSLEDIADVCPAYTRGGFDDDEPQAGAEKGTFTDTTSPTAEHVEGLIATACQEVAGRVGVEIPERCYELARTTAKWHVAAAISAGKIPAGTDDASGEYRSHISNYRFSLDDLKEQVQLPRAVRLA